MYSVALIRMQDLELFSYIPLKLYKTNYLLHYLLITLRNITRTIIPRGAVDYDNPVAINIERNKSYRVNQKDVSPARKAAPKSHQPIRIIHCELNDALKRLLQNCALASVEEFEIRIWDESGV